MLRSAEQLTPKTYGAGCTVAWQTDDADVMGKIFAAKLGTEADAVCFGQELLLQFNVAESAARLVARRGQVIVIMGRSQFHGQQIFSADVPPMTKAM